MNFTYRNEFIKNPVESKGKSNKMKVYKNSAYKNKFHFYIPTMKGS